MINEHNLDLRAAFFDMAHSPFAILDKDLRFLDINETTLIALDIKKQEVLGKKLVEILPGIETTERYRSYLNVLKTGIPINIDRVELKIKGKLFYFLIKAFKVGSGLGLAGLNTTNLMNTIDDLKFAQYEAEIANMNYKERNEELEEFSYVAAHDLKAPLINVKTLLEMLKEENMITTDGTPLFLKLQRAVGLMSSKLQVLNEVIALKSNIGDAKKIVDFKEMIDDISTEICEDINRTKTNIVTDFTKCPKIYIDPIQLHSVLYNLINNAIKYRHPERAPIIEVVTFMRNNKTQIEISDNGLGFDKEQHGNKLFGLFKRMHTHIEGLGVGLYIVKSIVNSLGGMIDVSSEINKGTTFKLMI